MEQCTNITKVRSTNSTSLLANDNPFEKESCKELSRIRFQCLKKNMCI